jgi:regulator of sigma D
MESMEEKMKRIEYYQQLFLKMVKSGEFPFYELIIEKGISKGEVEEIFSLCDKLTKQYEEQKEEGFVHFDSLLTQFAGMLTAKLNPTETIEALLSQSMYQPLMKKLKELDEKRDT